MRTSIRAARAAAVLLVASGLSGAVSTFLPRVDERWIFVVAVAVIAGTEGFVIGLVSAIAAVACYELMTYSAVAFSAERDVLLLGAGLASALAARGATVTATRRQIPTPPHQFLLPPAESVMHEEAEELRRRAERVMAAQLNRIAQLNEELQDSHSRIAELERKVQAENELVAVQHALDAARSTSESLAARVEELEDAFNASEWHADELKRERDEARAESRSLTARITELKRMLEERPTPGLKRFILLIHHDAMLRSMAKHALERNGYRVTTATDGLEALRVAMIDKPDVILADMHMPKMDGRALVQLLKSRHETAGTKIVLIGEPPPGSGTTDFHPDDFVLDPGNFEAMRETIEAVLSR